ncbi:MAG: NAD(P)/FAD-dependent oxidoreductase [Bacteroidota bacterium]|nr:NAD(P)/FAD-dependent oxidoreductase [Bacteroidota bacterium]
MKNLISNKKNILIIGGGFAGMQLSRHLDESFFNITLLDKINHHQFQPLFYQVATSQIEPSSISFPFRNAFKNKNHIQIRMAEVSEIDHQKQSVQTNIGEFKYDYLVIAIGCKTNFFGNSSIQKHAFTLKSTYDAIEIRNHILLTFERIISSCGAEREALLNLVIVGAGPTGVELAGAFAEIKQNILPNDYHGIDFSEFKIILIEGSSNTLNSMSENARKASRKYLQSMNVDILTETFVKDYDGNSLVLSNGNVIITKTVIWAAGVTGNTIIGLPHASLVAGNRIKVNRINAVEGINNVFAIGDIAYMSTPLYPNAHPQLANVAINQAKLLAKNLPRMMKNKPTKPYEYKNLGSMATIGRNKAVVDLPFFRFKGYFAWVIWMFLHLMLILSVKNKLIIFIHWAWAYISKDSSLRLILKSSNEKNNN